MDTNKQGFSHSDLRDFVNEILDLWHVPGLAVAVVNEDQVILCEGFGIRNILQGLPVTPETLFPIASCTKAFTTLALGMLVDAGQIDWDRPVKQVLPALKLWDPYATERITTRDLLTHRSGLPGHDMMWFATRFKRREIFDRLQFLEPTCDLRTRFQYQNLMYLVAGLLIEEISGNTWEEFVQARILDPLGMDRTTFSTRLTQQSCDYAVPYRYRAGRIHEMAYREHDGPDSPMTPAGGIISCARDMAKWLQFLLNGGKKDGHPLISVAAFNQIFTPQVFMGTALARGRFGDEFLSYGFGWEMRSHKGHFLVQHDGQTDGFYSLASLLPRDGLSIVALSNADSYYNPVQDNQAPEIVTYTLYDRLLGLNSTDWNGLMRTAHDEMSLAMVQSAIPPSTNVPPASPPSHPIESYLGEYEHPGYGRVSIRKTEGGLRLVMNDTLDLPMLHCRGETFEVIFELVDQRQEIAFSPSPDGAVQQVAIPMEPRVSDVIFTRVSI